MAEHMEALISGHLSTEYRLVTRAGGTVWIYDDALAVLDEKTGRRRLVGFCIDTTSRRRVEEELRASNEQFRAVTANVPGAVYRCEVSQEWTVRFMSDYIEQLAGYPASDFVDSRVRSYGSIICAEDHPLVTEKVNEALSRGSDYSVEYRLVHADGTARWVAEHGRAVPGPDGEPEWLDGLILDISRAKLAEHARDQAEDQLRHQALHDALTGLPNRVLFHERVTEALALARGTDREVVVLMLDLDRFKEINDTLGHAAGDELLKEVAGRLSSCLRASDSIARLGGDEFAILLSDASTADFPDIAERVARCLEEPIIVDELPLNIQISTGLASFPKDSDDAQGLLQRADVAMYLAKAANSAYASYDPSTDRHDPSRLALLNELRRAIDRSELVVFYQPQVNVNGADTVGVEALIRWRHPHHGLVPPDELIPFAQETGLVKQLTHYLLTEALRQCRAWIQETPPIRVAVRLAMRNLIDVAFPGEVAALLERWSVPAVLLEFEITEESIAADPRRVKAVVERLAAMGARLSVGGFGTGCSSLAYLKRLAINEIKIDRSLVINMMSSPEDEVVVRSIITLGHNLGLEVLADGVDTPEALQRLEEMGCDLAQGVYVSRPLPPEQLAIWLGPQMTDNVPDRSGELAGRGRAV
jgi:diguanylate cyclase (GGDEF)-like protein/PAS domain S-box-containing protein